MSAHPADTDVSQSRMVSRRTLVRAGATAAWCVPVIQVVGAAPAFAAVSNQPQVVIVPDGHYKSGDNTKIDVTVNLTNSSSTAPSGAVLTVTLPFAASAVSAVSGATLATGSGSTWTFTLNPPLGANGSALVNMTFTVANTAGGTGSVNLSASNMPSGGASSPLVITQAAASGTTLNSLTVSGAYVTGDANQLSVTTSVKNNGSAPATSLDMKVTLPFASSGVVQVPTGWSVTGSGTTWTFRRGQALAAGVTDGFTVRFGVSNYAGGQARADASASNVATGVSATATVAAAPNSTMAMRGTGGTGTPSVTPIQTTGNLKTYRVRASVLNTGPRTISGVQLTVNLGRAMNLNNDASSGWTTTQTGSRQTWTFTRTDSTLPGAATGDLSVIVSDNGGVPTVTYSATATNATAL